MTKVSTDHLLVFAIAAAGTLLLVRVVVWLAIWLLETSGPRFHGVSSSRVGDKARSWLVRLRQRAPRVHLFILKRLSPRQFSGLPLTLFIFGALYMAALLAGLVEEIVEAQGILQFDRMINASLDPWRGSPLVGVFLQITVMGAGPTLTVVSVVATASFWSFGRPHLIVPLWATVIGAEVTTWIGKYAIARHRPISFTALHATSPGFPSGHATAAMALYGFLAYALARDLTGRCSRLETVFAAATLVLAIDVSRIFLSVHYTTDVVAGNLVGAFWLMVGFALAEWWRERSVGYAAANGTTSD